MIIGVPLETTAAAVQQSIDAAVAAYIAAHPPSINGEFKPGFIVVNAGAPDLQLVGYDSSDNILTTEPVVIGDVSSGLLRYYVDMPADLHHYKLTIPLGYSYTGSLINALGTTHLGIYDLNADGGQEITLMRFVFETMHLFQFITIFEKINTGDYYSTGYAEGYANYPISNPVHTTYFLTVVNTTPSQLHVDFWNADGFLYSIVVPVSSQPDPFYIHDISEFPQPVHMVIHSDAVYKIDTLYWAGGDGGGTVYNTVNGSTIDLTSDFFERSLTQIWS